jgi:hypothetical protein
MHYVTHRSYRMQKHKFGMTCPGMLFTKTAPGPPSMKNSASMFCALNAPEYTTWPQTPPDAKHKFSVTSPGGAVYKNRTGPTWARKIVCRRCTPGRTRMHYVTRRSHRMQKHRVCVTCLDALFTKTALSPLEQEKYKFGVHTHQNALRDPHIPSRQKHKFNVMCPSAFLVESVAVPPEHEK